MNDRRSTLGVVAGMAPLVAVLTAGLMLLMIARLGRADDQPTLEAAETLYKAGKWTDARNAYLANLEGLTGEQRATTLNRIAITWLRDQRDQNGADFFAQALRECPDASSATQAYSRLQLGRTLSALRKFDESIAQLKQIPAMPDLPVQTVAESYLSLATPYLKLERPDDAVAALSQVTQLSGLAGFYYGEAWMGIGRIRQSNKEYQPALDAFSRILTINGTSAHQRAYAQSYIEELKGLLEGDQPFYIAPYLVFPASTTGTLSWVSQGISTPGTVKVLREGQEPLSFTSTTAPIKGTVCFLHTVALTGLQAGTRYAYEITCDQQTRTGSFVTTHDDPQRPVTFAVISDTQTRGDLHRMVADAIAKDQPDIVLHAGDLTDRGATWGKWKAELFGPGEPYFSQAFFAATIGNHDGGVYTGVLMHLNPRQFYYSFSSGNAYVMVLDSYWNGSSRFGRAQQLEWLKGELAKAGDRWKIVLLHVPMVATSNNNECYWWGENDFLPLMEEAGVDLVLAGHQPAYRRYLPIGQPGRKPILHVVSAGGGPVGNPEPSPILDLGVGKCHHSLITVQGNRLELTAKLPDGTVIDQFVLEHDDQGQLNSDWMSQLVDRQVAKQIRHLYEELLSATGNLLMLDVEGDLTPGQPAKLVLDQTRLPRGAMKFDELPEGLKLVIEAAPDSGWQVTPTVADMRQPRIAVPVTPPAKLKVSGGRMLPSLQLSINLELNGRRFTPHLCTAALHAEAAARVTAVGDFAFPSLWDFAFDPQQEGEKLGWQQLTAPASGDWRKANLTQLWEQQFNDEYDGHAWYRTSFTAAALPATQRLWLQVGAIDESCSVWLNGQPIATQLYNSQVDDDAWRKPRRFDLTAALRPGANVLAVRVQDLTGMGGITGGATLEVLPANQLPDEGFAAPSAWASTGSTPTPCPGRYVEQPAVRVTVAEGQPVTLTRACPVNLPAGMYELRLGYRARLLPQTSVPPLRVQVTTGGAALLSVVEEPVNDEAWQTITRPLRLAQPVTGPLQIELNLAAAGIFELDQLVLTAADPRTAGR